MAEVIVVPCFNEACRLDVEAFREFARTCSSVLFLFVDDGSTDPTPEVIQPLLTEAPDRFELLTLANNMGKGEAVRQGMLRALRAGAERVGYWDADLATPLAAIREFSAVLDARPEIEMVLATRIPLLGRSVQRKAVRRWMGRLFSISVSAALGLRLYDTQCGAKLFRATPALAAALRSPFSSRWIFDVELLARLVTQRNRLGFEAIAGAVYEYPLHEWREVSGSKLRFRDIVRAMVELPAITWRYQLAVGEGGKIAAAGRLVRAFRTPAKATPSRQVSLTSERRGRNNAGSTLASSRR